MKDWRMNYVPLDERMRAVLTAEGMAEAAAAAAVKALMPLIEEHADQEYEGGIEYGTSGQDR